MKHYLFRLLTLSMLIALLMSSVGCSLFGSGKKKDGEDDAAALAESDLEKRYAMGNIPLAEGEGIFKDVHFDYDSTAINDAARQAVEFNVQILQSNPAYTVKLEGHCDERGTNEYNLALGSERARAVRDVLTSYGIASSRISSISYGEEIPLDPGHDDVAYARNRRVHFAVGSGTSGNGVAPQY